MSEFHGHPFPLHLDIIYGCPLTVVVLAIKTKDPETMLLFYLPEYTTKCDN